MVLSPPPPELLAALEADPENPSAWAVLDDWAVEHAPGLARMAESLPGLDGVTFRARWRGGLASHGFVRFALKRPPHLSGLEPLLRAPPLRLMTSLNVGYDWPPSDVMLFGTAAQPQLPPPRTILPGILTALLASAPPALRSLGIWLPVNPPWGGHDDCCSQLEPLMRQRPVTAEHLELRLPRKGAVTLISTLVKLRWRSITLAAPLNREDLDALALLAARAKEVELRLVRSPGLRVAAPVRLVDDPTTRVLTVEGVRDVVTAHAGDADFMPFLEAGLSLRSDLGFWELARGSSLPSAAEVFVNGEALKTPIPLQLGKHLEITVHVPQFPPPGHARSSGEGRAARTHRLSLTFDQP